MSLLEELLKAAEQSERCVKILPEAAIMELRGAAERYEQHCPFKPGDLITPRANSPIVNDEDNIYIVVEVFSAPVRSTFEAAGTWTFYGKTDFRALTIRNGEKVIPYAGESWMFEPYTGEAAGGA